MSDLAAAQAALRTTFGFDAFRPGQADIIGTILAGRDVLACFKDLAILRSNADVGTVDDWR